MAVSDMELLLGLHDPLLRNGAQVGAPMIDHALGIGPPGEPESDQKHDDETLPCGTNGPPDSRA